MRTFITFQKYSYLTTISHHVLKTTLFSFLIYKQGVRFVQSHQSLSLFLSLPALFAPDFGGSVIPNPPLIKGPPSIIFGLSYSSSVLSLSSLSTLPLLFLLLLSSRDGSRSPRAERSRLCRSWRSLRARRRESRSPSSSASSRVARAVNIPNPGSYNGDGALIPRIFSVTSA